MCRSLFYNEGTGCIDTVKLLQGNVFSSEICEIFKNTFENTSISVERLQTDAHVKCYLEIVDFVIAAHQGGFIIPCVWEIVVRKNLTNFEGCHFARFYILIWQSFPKIETNDFNSGSYFFKLVKLGTISPAAHFLNCVHIGRSQKIASIICGLSSGKRL